MRLPNHDSWSSDNVNSWPLPPPSCNCGIATAENPLMAPRDSEKLNTEKQANTLEEKKEDFQFHHQPPF